MDSSDVQRIITQPKGCDKNVWMLEHIRQFVLELNLYVTQLKAYCTPQTCPVMRVNSESYRCVVKNELKEVNKKMKKIRIFKILNFLEKYTQLIKTAPMFGIL